MAKIAVVTDTHFGARSDSPAFMQSFENFYNNVFFPEIDRRGIAVVIHAGDLVDRKKFINYTTAQRMRKCFVEQLTKRHLLTFFIPGNHDSYYRHSLEVNGISEMLNNYKRFNVLLEPTHINLEGVDTLFLPWICEANEKQTLEMVNTFNRGLCVGHLELAGFETYKGHVMEKGMDLRLFTKFKQVISGHYHEPSQNGNIRYLGAPYEMTWSDYNCARGFSILDTDDLSLEYIMNSEQMHHKIIYDDKDLISPIDYEKYTGKVIKVVVINRTDHAFFEKQIKNLEQVAADVQVVEDHMHQDEQIPEVELEAIGGPLETLADVVNESQVKADRVEVMALMRNLYQEAVRIGGRG